VTVIAPASLPSRAAGIGLVAGLHAAVIALLLADAVRPIAAPAGRPQLATALTPGRGAAPV
jgi:hypothetical protein